MLDTGTMDGGLGVEYIVGGASKLYGVVKLMKEGLICFCVQSLEKYWKTANVSFMTVMSNNEFFSGYSSTY